MFTAGMFVGVGLLALWVHVRFPQLEPASLRRAVVHCAASLALFHAVPFGTHETVLLLPLPASVVTAVMLIIVPSFCYVLLSWLWLLARVRDHTNSSPRGGHPVRS